jgi:hypothetical protein
VNLAQTLRHRRAADFARKICRQFLAGPADRLMVFLTK